MRQKNIEVTELEGGNIWCRDYLPVKGAKGNYVDFVYQPSYNRDNLKGQKQIIEAYIAKKDWKKKSGIQIEYSSLILDGGSIEVFGSKCLVSTHILADNPKRGIEEIANELKLKLGVDSVCFIQQHPYDFTGHADGIVRFVDENFILINDLSQEKANALTDTNDYRRKLVLNWIEALQSVIYNAGFETLTMPYEAHNNSGSVAYGIYMNFLKLDGHIFMPSFGHPKDAKAKETLAEIFNREVHMIPGTELAKQGGIINCGLIDIFNAKIFCNSSCA